jgi:hypothetical protein
MKLIGKTIALGFAVATASVVACSTGPHSQQTGTNNPPVTSPGDGTGNVGFEYTLPGGEHITTVHYHLTNGTNTYDANVNVGTSSVISFVIGGVTAGTGYTITLNANTDDGAVTCTGSFGTGVSDAGQNNGSPFAVAARTTTTVNVQLICVDNANTNQGSVLVNGIPNCCPTWDTMVSNPGSTVANPIVLGASTALSGNASGPCDGDAGSGVNLNCVWSVKSGTGTISTTTNAGMGNFNATLTCPAADSGVTGEVDVVQMDCTDGPLPDGGFCPSFLTHGELTVFCGLPPPCSLPSDPPPHIVASPNTAAGTCGTDPGNGKVMVNGGLSNGNFCCIDACGGGPTATPFGPTGTCTGGLVNNGAGCCVSLLPCTFAGQTNCVTCSGNSTTGGVCSPTEAKLVQHDINKGLVTAPGPDSATTTCYGCLLNFTCIDDTNFGDTAKECEDPVITIGTAAQCESIVDCVFLNSCANPQVSNCYCGTAPTLGSCSANPSGENGICAPQEAAGIGFGQTDGTDIVNHFTDGNRAGGVANKIFGCGINNGCTNCLH